MEISCDGEGRVTSYYFYDNTLRSEKKLTTLSKEDIISFADSFIKKSAPEAFSDENDCFVYDDESWYVNNLTGCCSGSCNPSDGRNPCTGDCCLLRRSAEDNRDRGNPWE